MNFCLLSVIFVFFSGWTTAMLYRRVSDNVLKPDLLAVSSTVLPLPYYSVFGYEKKLLQGKNKKRPPGKISLVTRTPK
ncbi:uncharacterized protein LOC105385690 [Plutella xylostella]|uniref:uncharacterized protein LOC105385690 n=1 Tax=Plutella xylostella TaxID=51655 RepID=UPI0020324B2F|nr:uncharacterized protein LOC105385690 [Plutella xylostella]